MSNNVELHFEPDDEATKYYPGCLGYKNLDNDMVLVLQPMTFGTVALNYGVQRDAGFDKQWSYPAEAVDLALKALMEFDGDGDPSPGWTRAYPPYYRRRPHGDPREEYIEP